MTETFRNRHAPSHLLALILSLIVYDCPASVVTNETAIGVSWAPDLKPSETDVYVRRGVARIKERHWTEARGEFDAAIRIDPDQVAAYQLRGCCAFALGAFDLALMDFGEVIRRAPMNHEAYLSRANCYMAKKNFLAALPDLNKSIELNPTNALAFNSRASAHNAINQFANAIADCDSSLGLAPGDSRVYVMRGFAFRKTGNHEKALRDFAKAIQGDPKNAEALNQLAWLRATCPDKSIRNGKESVEAARKACDLTNWEQPQNIDTLAAGYAELGNFKAAIQFQKQALEFDRINIEFSSAMQERLLRYEQSLPYREADHQTVEAPRKR